MKNQEPIKPTGNLEELFRHHLAEAAVPPRPHVWEQVDNALLLAQNQTYRRRLQATRWVAAASLLLASLAGTGWWMQRDAASADVAANAAGTEQLSVSRRQKPAFDDQLSAQAARVGMAARATAGGNQRPGGANRATQPAAAELGEITNAASSGNRRRLWSGAPARLVAVSNQQSGRVKSRLVALGNRAAASSGPNRDRAKESRQGLLTQTAARQADYELTAANTGRTKSPTSSDTGVPASVVATTAQPGTFVSSAVGAEPASALTSSSAASPAAAGLTTTASLPAGASLETGTTAAGATGLVAADSQPQSLLPLAGAVVSLAPRPVALLPTALALQPKLISQEPAMLARRWRLGLRYTTGAFQSNVNFSRAGTDPPYPYNPALGANSPALTEAAAAEYLAQQRPGPGLRLQLQASRRLDGHWGLSTGLEVTQLDSKSSTSYIFNGEQVYDYNQPLQGGPRRSTTARYRTLGIPMELHYANPAKTGFSLYGRVGAVISALLSSRTDVEANPEATRTYNLFSASTPYRRLLGTLRGAVGMQFRPVGHDYTLSLGPVAEGGIWSLNAHPAQDFFGQYRPYSVGLEAGVEFGRGVKLSKAAE